MMRIHMEGTGRVARTLAPLLGNAGFSVTVGGRNQVAAGAIAQAPKVDLLESSEPIAADVVLILVGDDAIEHVAQKLVPRLGSQSSILHASGFHGTEVLEAAAAIGCPTGWLHPLGSFSGQQSIQWLIGLTWCMGGHNHALSAAHDIVEHLGGRPFPMIDQPGARARYHAAASLLAGGTAALFDLAEQLVRPDLSEPDALREGFSQLLSSVVAQIAHEGPRVALTGPAARGDAAVLSGHLAEMDPLTHGLYTQLIEHMQRMARERDSG